MPTKCLKSDFFKVLSTWKCTSQDVWSKGSIITPNIYEFVWCGQRTAQEILLEFVVSSVALLSVNGASSMAETTRTYLQGSSLLTVMRELLVSIISTKLTRLRLLIAGKPEGFKFCLVYCDWLGKAAYAAITLAFEIYLLSIDITSFLVDHHKIIQNPCFSSIRTHRFP